MTSSRDTILAKLRAVQRPFPNATPRPAEYLSVTDITDISQDGLLARFTEELTRLRGNVHAVTGDAGATEKVLALLTEYEVTHILAWDFQYIPVAGLQDALTAAGIEISFPDLHDEFRAETGAHIKQAGAGVIGADAALATTGSLVVSTAPGKGRVPTVLPPVLIAVVTIDQLLPRVESWIARERALGLPTVRASSNIAFITGPSRTGDIEMQLVLGVHGPGIVHVIVKR